jgi:hypothetical protein
MAVSGGIIIKSDDSDLVWHTVATGGFLKADAQMPSQNILNLNLTGVHWAGQWVVTRGANTIWESPATTAGSWNLDGLGLSLALSPGANVHCVLTGAGTLVLEFDKDTQ